MNDLDWNDYFDNDREAGGDYETPDEYNARVLKNKQSNNNQETNQD